MEYLKISQNAFLTNSRRFMNFSFPRIHINKLRTSQEHWRECVLCNSVRNTAHVSQMCNLLFCKTQWPWCSFVARENLLVHRHSTCESHKVRALNLTNLKFLYFLSIIMFWNEYKYVPCAWKLKIWRFWSRKTLPTPLHTKKTSLERCTVWSTLTFQRCSSRHITQAVLE
jgi:hypothetical protein